MAKDARRLIFPFFLFIPTLVLFELEIITPISTLISVFIIIIYIFIEISLITVDT